MWARDLGRQSEDELLAAQTIASAGYPVMPFGMGEWRDRCPMLAACLDIDDDDDLRAAPDLMADSCHGVVFVEVINSGTHDNHGVDLPKLVALRQWANVAPVVILDVSDDKYLPVNSRLTRIAKGYHNGVRPTDKPFVTVPRERSYGFNNSWPTRGGAL